MTIEARKKMMGQLLDIGRVTGINLVVIIGALAVIGQTVKKDVVNPYIDDRADSSYVRNHKQHDECTDTIKLRMAESDSLQRLTYYYLAEILSNDQKLRARDKMNEAKGYYR